MSKVTKNPVLEAKGAEAAEVEEEEAETAEALHGVINPREAERYIQILDEILSDLVTKIRDDRVTDIMKDVLSWFKDTISRVVPQIVEADITKIMGSVADAKCLSLIPRTKERERESNY